MIPNRIRLFDTFPRSQRKQLLKAEALARKSGSWGDWETLRFPKGTLTGTWSIDMDTVHRNAAFSVLDGTIKNNTRHLAIASLSQIRPTWWEMQRIKRLFGFNS